MLGKYSKYLLIALLVSNEISAEQQTQDIYKTELQCFGTTRTILANHGAEFAKRLACTHEPSTDTCHCYDKLHDRPKSWEAANDKCMEMGGHLLTIDSEEELEVLNEGLHSLRHHGRFYIGLENIDNKWMWLNPDGNKEAGDLDWFGDISPDPNHKYGIILKEDTECGIDDMDCDEMYFWPDRDWFPLLYVDLQIDAYVPDLGDGYEYGYYYAGDYGDGGNKYVDWTADDLVDHFYSLGFTMEEAYASVGYMNRRRKRSDDDYVDYYLNYDQLLDFFYSFGYTKEQIMAAYGGEPYYYTYGGYDNDYYYEDYGYVYMTYEEFLDHFYSYGYTKEEIIEVYGDFFAYYGYGVYDYDYYSGDDSDTGPIGYSTASGEEGGAGEPDRFICELQPAQLYGNYWYYDGYGGDYDYNSYYYDGHEDVGEYYEYYGYGGYGEYEDYYGYYGYYYYEGYEGYGGYGGYYGGYNYYYSRVAAGLLENEDKGAGAIVSGGIALPLLAMALDAFLQQH